MTEAEFVAAVAEEIEEAVMRAQGIGDWMGDVSPQERARSIASLLPAHAFSEAAG
jgi:hypothetical protein